MGNKKIMDQDIKNKLDNLEEIVVNTSQRLEKAEKSSTSTIAIWLFIVVVLLGFIGYELYSIRKDFSPIFELTNGQSTSTRR
jgi:hypothetical protein